jgi:hypothetical protein
MKKSFFYCDENLRSKMKSKTFVEFSSENMIFLFFVGTY